mgnify:CR=1 FL=1
MRIYLDHNATTPVAPEVADAMATALRTTFGNPSSLHRHGQEAKTALDEARAAVARLLGWEGSGTNTRPSYNTVLKACQRGDLKARQTAGRKSRWLIRPSDAIAWRNGAGPS